MDGEDDTVDAPDSSADSGDESDGNVTADESTDADEPDTETGEPTEESDQQPTDDEESAQQPTDDEESVAESTETADQSQPPANDEAQTAATDEADQDTDDSSDATDKDAESPEPSTAKNVRDQITRRRVAGGVALLVVVLSLLIVLLVPASLLSLVYSPSAEFAAQPATVDQGTVDEYGYEEVTSESFEVTEPVQVLGQTKSIVTTNHRENYERTVAVQNEQLNSAIFTVVSTPAIEVGNSPMNPIAEMSHKQILSEFSSDLEGGYEGLRNVTKVTEREGVLLGEQTTISQFETTVDANGETVAVSLYVGTVRSDGDIVVVVGGHPAPFAQERVSVLELLSAVDHPVSR